MAVFRIRPKGYEYPIGLSSYFILTPTDNAATNTTGGDQTVEGNNVFHIFTTTDDFVTPFAGNVDVLVVAGGGGGQAAEPGGGGYGGGGGGGVVAKPDHNIETGTFTITIGAGGTGSTGIGSNTTFDTLVAWGGGHGGYSPSLTPRDGGSGGGGGQGQQANNGILQTNNPSLPADSRTYGYGNYGGVAVGPPSFGGGAGGGAGAAGGNGVPTSAPGPGGAGKSTPSIPWLITTTIFSPTANTFAGGGAAGGRSGNGAAGPGGGGPISSPGTVNRGGGGGAAPVPSPVGAPLFPAGGSGIAVIRYNKVQTLRDTAYTIN